MNPKLHISDTPEATATEVARVLVDKAKQLARQSKPFNMALSGGTTPKLLFSILANDFADQMPWHIIRLFWVDERCVPPTHPESNFGMTYNSLLRFAPIHDSNIFRMLGEADPQKEALRYEELLTEQLPIVNALPQFDVVLLGMGDDGHTASIFPDNPALLTAPHLVADAVHPTTGQHRITLTGSVLQNAVSILFLVTGSTKNAVLRSILKREEGYKKYPTTFFCAKPGNVSFYVDSAAAKDLE